LHRISKLIFIFLLDIIINNIKTKFAENNLKILNALQNYLSTRKNRDEDILEDCKTYNINFDALKVKLMLFGKMCSSNNTDEHFGAHLNLYLEKDLIGSFDNIYFIYKMFLSIPISSASSELRFHHFVTSKHLQKTPLAKKDLITWLFYILKKLLKLILILLLISLMQIQQKEVEDLNYHRHLVRLRI
jgi:hypothetical protein